MSTQNTKHRRIMWIAVGFAIAVLAGFSFEMFVPRASADDTSSSSLDTALTTAPTLTDEHVMWAYQDAFRAVAQEALPVVVKIDTVEMQTVATGNPFSFFFGQNNGQQPQTQEVPQQGLGSGVIVRRAGDNVYVLTNAHVVDGADQITVTLWDGRDYDGSIVGSDDRRDLALVVFQSSEDIPIAALGDSDQVQVGDWAFAVGNPLGFESTVTAGIISAVGRRPGPQANVATLTDYIQTDASINQGNSGGALVNLAGEVIGINSWIASQSGGNVGLGFAIPINNAKRAIDEFISYGQVEYGYLGVFFGGSITNEVAVSMGTRQTTGAFVGSVLDGSPADNAGIEPGDIIREINGTEISDWNDLVNTVAELEPGTRTVFTIWRNGNELTVRPRIARREDDTSAAESWPGIAVLPLTDELRASLNLQNERGSVVIADVYANSPAAEAGLVRGDIIRQVNGQDVGSLAEFYQAVNGRSGDELMFRLVRQGREYVIGLVR